MSLKDIAKVILESNTIGISFHASPDGDATGSALALYNALKELGKDVYILSKEEVPEGFAFLPGAKEIDGRMPTPTYDTDLVIVVDCGNRDRVCANIEDFCGTLINIDHHVTNEMYGVINYIETKSAATAEIIYLLLKELGFAFDSKAEVFKTIGTCIFTGIVTDTGCFRHSNVTQRTHDISGELINVGVNNTEIYDKLFNNKPYEKVKLIGYALNKLELVLNNKVSFIELSKAEIDSFNLKNSDTSDIISIALGIKGVEVAVITKEDEDGVKASLRSKSNFDVRKVAEALGGGGHVKAAGLKLMNKSLEETKYRIIKEIEKEM